ncbi:MAG: M48 family metalloprotease [Burkholderiaceae bacterium]|nr:M48 family metalloprotease [Burkholderiaceae bacterium]
MRAARLPSRCMAGLLAAVLAIVPPLAQSQIDNLPRLGDASADELSPSMERRIGESIVGEMQRRGMIDDDAELTDWLNRFALALTGTTPAAGYTFRFFLVRDSTLNAFALPGGFVGVHTGLVVGAQSESELASVLAHEIGHVTQRHIARMLSRQRQGSVVMIAAMVLAALAAGSNPQAAGGLASLGSTVAQQQMLGFSRDAEREADRVGLEMLRQAGFDSNAMVSFLHRLQSAGSLYESGAPEYLRTHPVTSARIADIQSRISEGRYRQRADSLEFRLARAKLRALGDTSVDGLQAARVSFERQLRDRTIDEAAGWFGLATVAAARRDPAQAREAIAEVRRRLTEPHRFVERLAAQVELDAGRPQAALALLDAALARDPSARALLRLRGQALFDGKRYAEAVSFLEQSLAMHRDDPRLWELLSEAQQALDRPALAHKAAAERFVLLGALPAAVEQLRLAQRSRSVDFHVASQIDSRLRELEAQWTREREERVN